MCVVMLCRCYHHRYFNILCIQLHELIIMDSIFPLAIGPTPFHNASQFEDISDVESTPGSFEDTNVDGNGYIVGHNNGFSVEDQDAVYHLLNDENVDGSTSALADQKQVVIGTAGDQRVALEERRSWDVTTSQNETEDFEDADPLTIYNWNQELSNDDVIPEELEEEEVEEVDQGNEEEEEYNGSDEEGYEDSDDVGSTNDDQELDNENDWCEEEENGDDVADSVEREESQSCISEDRNQFDDAENNQASENLVDQDDTAVGPLVLPADQQGKEKGNYLAFF